MTVQNQQASSEYVTTHDELILVIKRDKLFAQQEWQGLKEVDHEYYLKLIEAEKEFLPRSIMECDPRYKQIIPYLVFTHDNKYFLMQRQAKATEQRLKNKFSLGIGGHIRQEDIADADIINWARREFEEEVDYTGTYSVKALGMLNDDSNPVGEVHVGFVFLLEGSTDAIRVNSELKSGQLYTLAECEYFQPMMESWSQIVFDTLKKL